MERSVELVNGRTEPGDNKSGRKGGSFSDDTLIQMHGVLKEISNGRTLLEIIPHIPPIPLEGDRYIGDHKSRKGR